MMSAMPCWSGLLANYGPGWVVLMVWALLPGEPDPRLLRARETKYYDAFTALPLILWFAYGVLQQRPVLVNDAHLIAAGTATLFHWLQFVSVSLVVLFDLLLIYLLVVRDRPVAKSRGVLPRLFGFVGTFLGVGILQLPAAHLSLAEQVLAALLVGLGSLGSALVLWRLGKSFSIMPEARRLVTGGPYALARHPLYSVEMITICGTALQFQAPWSWVLAAVVLALLWIRSHYEEQVLEAAYPEYGAYRARTKRFIPGRYLNSTFTISYDRAPPGAATSTVSPLLLPIRARAMGEESEMRPCLASDSTSPTIWYLRSSSVSSSTRVTVAPNLTLVPDSLEMSITSARPIWSSSSITRPSMKLWRSLAA